MSVQQRKTATITVALASEKGGVGKTTLTAIFLAMLSMLGYKVLGIDMDPQGHLGLIYAYHRDTIAEGIYDILLKYAPNVLRERAPIKRIIRKTYYDQSGRIFDPRKPNKDSLDIVLRKVPTRNHIEQIISESTHLQGLFSFEAQFQDDGEKETQILRKTLQRHISEAVALAQEQGEDLSKYATSTIWYTIQQHINEAMTIAQEQGIEGDELKAQLDALIQEATSGRYTLDAWEATQAHIDEVIWTTLQERLSNANQGPDIVP